MPVIGIRELRERTSEVLRQVREDSAEYVITHQGRPVALILPINPDAVEEAMVEASKANLAGGVEAYARLVAGGERQASPRAIEPPRSPRLVDQRSRGPRGSVRGRAEPAPSQERGAYEPTAPEILD